MEQVLELFARARRQQMSLEALRVALEGLLTRTPQGLAQGLSWLDLAQQREPIPVTDFVTLRQDLADHLRLAKLSRGEDDTRVGKPGETTEIQREMTVRRDAPHLPSDETLAAALGSEATLVASAPPPGASDATLVASAPPIGASDATLVASAPPPGSSDATLVASAPPLGASDATLVASAPPPGSSDATLVASAPPLGASDATLVASAPPAGFGDATQVAPSPPPPTGPSGGPGQAESTLAAPSLDRNSPSAHERKPTLAIAATAVAIAALSAVLVMNTGRDPEPAASGSLPASPAEPSGQAATVSTDRLSDTQATADSADRPGQELPASSGVMEPAVNTDVDADTPVAILRLEVESAPATVTAPAPEPLPTSMEALSALLEKRIAEGRIDPADGERSAGHVLAAMIALKTSDLSVSEGRSKLADAHRRLAKAAREAGDLDAAQTHMDHAYDVLLMGLD
jgi:hypothetical protein